ncbi:MAG: SH3 domain-containing protein [Anaerolineae bacterium]
MLRLLVVALGLLVILIFGRAGLSINAVTAQSAPDPNTQLKPDGTYVSSLRDYGPAPEISGESWLNTDMPLRLTNLKGKVVLLDMWTFGCINCIHIIPSVRDWHEKYADQGLVIIGNHFPEFSYEHDIANIRDALVRLDVPYAVTQDNGGDTWRAYNNRYWPTVYLIDKQGHLRYGHIGEGGYDTTEAAIQDLLKETYTPSADDTTIVALDYLTPTIDLNVRSGSSTNTEIVGAIKPGEVFVIRGEDNGWYRIQYNDGEGFVSGEYVTVSRSGEAA